MKKITRLTNIFAGVSLTSLSLATITACSCGANVQTFTITFDTDGGTEVPNQTVLAGGKLAQPVTTKTGFVVKHWLNGSDIWNFDNVVTANMTLKVVWQEAPSSKYHTVTFDTQVEGISVDPQSVEDNRCAIEPAVKRDGYQITAWTYNDVPFSFKTPITSDITLKATWEEISVVGGNLDSIQYPTIAPAAYKEYDSTNKIVDAYLLAIKDNTDIFKQDILYSWSYSNVYQKLQLLKIIKFDKYSTNIEISNIDVDTDEKTIDFDVKIKTEYKINDSVEKSWIEWIGWNCRALKGTSNIHYTLNLTDSVREIQDHYYDEESYANAVTIQNTTLDSGHVKYIDGICAIRYNDDSSMNIIKEAGTYVDLDGTEGEYSRDQEYQVDFVKLENLEDIKNRHPIAYSSTSTFINVDTEETFGAVETEQSLAEIPEECEECINGDSVGFKFVSCYMAASNLTKDHIFEYISCGCIWDGYADQLSTTVYRLNRALDDLHFYWLTSGSDTLTLPVGVVNPYEETGYLSYTIAENAFNDAYNKKIPFTSDKKYFNIKLCERTTYINARAFRNSEIGSINIPSGLQKDRIGTGAFEVYKDDETYGSVYGDIIIDSPSVASNLSDLDACNGLVLNAAQFYESVSLKILDGVTPHTWITENWVTEPDQTISGKTYHVYRHESL